MVFKAFYGKVMSVHSEMDKVPNTGIIRFFKKHKSVMGKRNRICFWVEEHDTMILKEADKFLYQDEFHQNWIFCGIKGNIAKFKPWPVSSEVPPERYEGNKLMLYASYRIV